MKNKKLSFKHFPTSQLASLRILIFVVIFAAAGVTYLLASHADTCSTSILGTTCTVTGPGQCTATGGATCTVTSTCNTLVTYGPDYIKAQDTSGTPLAGVLVNVSPNSGSTCAPTCNNVVTQAIFGLSNAIYCSGGTISTSEITIQSITKPGYIVAPSSLIKPGSLMAMYVFGTPGNTAMVTMEPAPPAPPPSSGGSGGSTNTTNNPPATGSSSGTTHHTSSGTTKAGTGSAPTTPSTTNPSSNSTPNPSSSDNTLGSTTTTTDQTGTTTADVPAGQTSQVISSDGNVTVTFPSGAFSTDAFCVIDAGDSNNVPPKTSNAIGPYNIDCTDSNGESLNLNKSVTVSVKLPSSKSQYAAYQNSTGWTKLSSSTDKQTIGFKLAKAEEFAVAQPKGSSLTSTLLNVGGAFIIILLFAGLMIWVRRRGSDIAPPDSTVDSGNW